MDFIDAKLKQFETAIERLPERPTAEQYIANPELYSKDGSIDLNDAKTLFNDFMGYVITLYSQQNNDISDEQWLRIFEIDSEFEDYFNYNTLPELPDDYKNAVQDSLGELPFTSDNVLLAVKSQFNLGMQMTLMRQASAKYSQIKHSLPNAKDYMIIMDKLESYDDKLLSQTTQSEEDFIETLSKPPFPKKP